MFYVEKMGITVLFDLLFLEGIEFFPIFATTIEEQARRFHDLSENLPENHLINKIYETICLPCIAGQSPRFSSLVRRALTTRIGQLQP